MKDKKDIIQTWVKNQLAVGSVPRLTDIYHALHDQKVTKKQIREVLLTWPEFQPVLPQQRPPLSSRRRRVIASSTLGYYHADIGFYAIQEKYPTPKKYQSGFLVLIDILSRYVLLEILPFNRKSQTMIKVLTKVIERHRQQHAYPIRGISFDQERSIVSKQVQAFLKDQHITFNDFAYSASKSKLAENTIARIRSKMYVLESQTGKPWWTLLSQVETNLNQEPLILYGHRLPNLTPQKITEANVAQLQKAMQQQEPSLYYSQFEINPALVSFAFKVGDRVKVKTKVISSQVLGPKRKIHQLSDDIFIIVQCKAYVRLEMSVGKCYTVRLEESSKAAMNRLHVFEEEELVKI